jgi:hypothetical protein
MATKKKLLQAAAGAAGGEVLDIDDVFSTFIHQGVGGSTDIDIDNGIDLSTEGRGWWFNRYRH